MSQEQGKGGADRGAGGRPGAMTVAMQAVQRQSEVEGPKVLRIGLIQGGKIVEERVIRKRETVSVGSSEKNHFVIPAEGIPSRFDVFELVGNDYVLNWTDGMGGRVGLPAGVKNLQHIVSSGAARSSGGKHSVKLTDKSRGKVEIGNATLLFQFVAPPPVQPRPQLPAAARGGFAKSIDWMFTAFVMFSFVSLFGFVVYLENSDWELESGLDVVPERFADLIFMEEEEPEEPEDEPEAIDEQAPEEDAPEVEEVAQPEAPQEQSPQTAEAVEERRKEVEAQTARMVEEAAAAAEAMLLGALGDGGGALADVLAGGAVTGNAEDVLAQASGVGVARSSSGGTLRTRSGGGSGKRTGGLGGLARSKAGNKAASEGGPVKERRIRGKVAASGGEDIGGTGDFDVSVVTRTVKRRLPAIKACYERELRRNPDLAGKVTVEFTIVERGTVSKARAVENTTGDSAVAGCVVKAVKRFRFNPGPDGGSVTYSYPFVFKAQN